MPSLIQKLLGARRVQLPKPLDPSVLHRDTSLEVFIGWALRAGVLNENELRAVGTLREAKGRLAALAVANKWVLEEF